MSAFKTTVDVPESRQVTLTLPAEVPVGEAELEVTVRDAGREPSHVLDVVLPPDDRPKAFPPRPTHLKLAAEYDAFVRMLPDLLAEHPGKYVAVHDGRVVAVGDSESGVRTAARQTHPGVLVLVRRVTDQPEPIQRVPTFRPV